MKLILKELHKENAQTVTLRFEPETPISWVPGQYLQYHIHTDHPDDRGEKRWFTIASAPHEKLVQITTRNSLEYATTFKKALFAMKPGDSIDAQGPEGDFTLENPQDSVVFVAGGIGITPYRSIIADLAYRNQQIPITLIYGNRDDQFVFKEELDAIASKHPEFTVQYLAGQPLDVAAIQKAVPDYQEHVVYVSGPEPMVEALSGALEAAGLPKDKLKQDFFPGYPAA